LPYQEYTAYQLLVLEFLVDQKDQFSIIIAAGVFSASLAIAAVLSSKIISVAGLFVPAGVLAYCLTFICTDVVGEVHGKKAANMVVLSGFVALVMVFLLIQIALNWAPAPLLAASRVLQGHPGHDPPHNHRQSGGLSGQPVPRCVAVPPDEAPQRRQTSLDPQQRLHGGFSIH
jgi:hypothetical protein